MSDRIEDLPAEEQEVVRDEAVADDPEPTETEYIEYVGDTKANGTFGLTHHEVSRKHLKDQHDITTDKDLRWDKDRKTGRFLVPVGDMSAEAAELLEGDPYFRRVTIKN